MNGSTDSPGRLQPGPRLDPAGPAGVAHNSFRVGAVRSLEVMPLTRGLDAEIVYATPAELEEMLARGELDAALLGVAELLRSDAYDVLDGVGIAALGEVKSAVLAHRRPIAEAGTVFYEPHAPTSLALLKVLLAERGLHPEFVPLEPHGRAQEKDFVLLAGAAALDFLFAPHEHDILDLGAEWYELTRLPFVFAVWALRRCPGNTELRHRLRAAKDFGMETLDQIIRTRSEYSAEFRKDYLGWHIHYYLGTDEKRAIARFAQLLEKHGLGPVHEARFVT
ncbi:MAG: menaquinone biosynthesis protein [Verrucomicrobiae bacterium]|nr:menaquinone biosynthesis protein [Verrucomicrobiae bacterium]